jgi:hypothetical protein
MAVDPEFILHSSGKKVAGVQVTNEEAAVVVREEVVQVDPETVAARTKVTNATPVSTAYGGVVRPVLALDTSDITRPGLDTNSETILTANADRKGIVIANEGPGIAYVKYGATASATSYTHRIFPGEERYMPWPCYTGVVDALSESTATLQITELE